MRALITGATSGIGRALAKELSHRGWSLILTGRNEGELLRLQKVLPTPVAVLPLDLSAREAPFRLYEFCKDKPVDLLVNNAGYGLFGALESTPLDDELAMLDVNIRALHILTKLFLRDFKRRNCGRILNVASSAGFLPGPLMSSYYASKAYVVRLTLAVHEELRRANSAVSVSLLCPGPVDTGFNDRAGVRFAMPAATAEYVAHCAADGVLRKKLFIIPTLPMKLAVLASGLAPERLAARVAYRVQEGKRRAAAAAPAQKLPR